MNSRIINIKKFFYFIKALIFQTLSHLKETFPLYVIFILFLHIAFLISGYTNYANSFL